LNRLILHRSHQRGSRAQVLGTTLIFNVPVNLDLRALSLVRHRGKRAQDLSRWVQILMLVQDGQTFVRLRFRSPNNGGRLPQGSYSLRIRNDRVGSTVADVPPMGRGGDGVTRLASWHQP